ncbi:MAG: SDR family NAD(P)-dependent oxidoreductase [Nitrospirae bacterium]|nr:SDR family NAD(P)-dependent oxidoreductase [Nitrospirota bacterium]
MRDLSGKWVLVTGAGSGIGRETALECGRRGAALVICDVNEEGLKNAEGDLRAMGREVVARRVDVADREAMRAFAAEVHGRIEAVDLLVNNAGVAIGGGFQFTSLEDWDWIVGINLMGVVHGCHFIIPPMVKRGKGGHVVNVASAAGLAGTEALSAYCTTKFAVVGLSESLRDELHRQGIGVTAICPGLINTPITSAARMKGDHARPEAIQRMLQTYERRNYTPDRVAQNILKAVQRNRAVAPVAAEAWLIYYAKRWAPGLLAWVGRTMGERWRRNLDGAG